MLESNKDSHHSFEIEGRTVPLCVRRHAQARRLILRIDEKTGGAVVTIPKRAAIRDGVELAHRKSAWIAAQLKRRGQAKAFGDGITLPVLGEMLIIRHDPKTRRTRRTLDQVTVSGRLEHLPRRLTDWLKSQARAEFSSRAHKKAAQIECRVSRISVRDTRSRWGSCGADGRLNFSWRLILAPEFVLDYVVAHEVAHLRHRDHGVKFWALTHSLTDRMKDAKTWLKTHGRELYRYGCEQ